MGSSSLTRDWTPGPWHWKRGIITTGPPGKSLYWTFKQILVYIYISRNYTHRHCSTQKSVPPNSYVEDLTPSVIVFEAFMDVQFSSVQLLSCVWLFMTPWTAARQASCPSPTPRAYSNSCPSSRWCHPTISSSVGPFSSHLQSFPASRSFPMSQFFASGGQSIGVSALASVLPMNIHECN